MEFRPCIDIHNGQVKQIVGGSLADLNDYALENFVSSQDASFYGRLYHSLGLKGGHVILLNPAASPYYEATKKQALSALRAYPGGLMAGGGICAENAEEFLQAGASHVIVTSYVFKDGQIHYPHLDKMVGAVGRRHLVLDLSCRRKGEKYYIVTDRWQKFTEVPINERTLDSLSGYCDEFLIHAADVEGRCCGIETQLAAMLGRWKKIPITYAGGVGEYHHMEQLRQLGQNHVHVTVGSALDLFGGKLNFRKVLEICGGAGP